MAKTRPHSGWRLKKDNQNSNRNVEPDIQLMLSIENETDKDDITQINYENTNPLPTDNIDVEYTGDYIDNVAG